MPETKSTFFVGADVGGTNIQTALVHPSGQILKRHRLTTPYGASCDEILKTIIETIRSLVEEAVEETPFDVIEIGGVGLAVPGLVEYRHNRITKSPNMAISGQDIVTPVSESLGGVPVTLANDCDAATMGERWQGAARTADTAIGLFIGTGIGGGILVDRKLLKTASYSIAEVGHICLDMNGPVCGCGNQGCLEALASRTAIEKKIRMSIEVGVPTILTEWLAKDQKRIRSGMLSKALEAGDSLVTRVLGGAADAIGHACVTFRHLFEPDLFVFGGGVMEACGDFMFPRIEKVVKADLFLASREPTRIVLSGLADDAGVLGAAVLAMEAAGWKPLDETYAPLDQPVLVKINPENMDDEQGVVQVGEDRFTESLLVRVDGNAKKLWKNNSADKKNTASDLSPKDLRRVCKGGPNRLLIGVDTEKAVSGLSKDAQAFLARRNIAVEVTGISQAVDKFHAESGRKALVIIGA